MPSHTMPGFKRDRHGNEKRFDKRDRPAVPTVRNAYTPMFEHFRDELDDHHDRRERIIKASRDITALSKKIIFSLQRVRRIHPDLPKDVSTEMEPRLSEIAILLATIASDAQGVNRWRYMHCMSCTEELIEAITFSHYLAHQSLMDFDSASAMLARLCQEGATKLASKHEPGANKDGQGADDKAQGAAIGSPADAMEVDTDAPTITLTEEDFLMGVFDLSGEMMRFATTTAALNGELASASALSEGEDESGGERRTIVADMQDLSSFFEMLPQRRDKSWRFKMETLLTSVKKVEKLGYGLTIRGSERPKGWMPDTKDSEPSSPV